MTMNTLKISVITFLLGHTSGSPDEDYEENIGKFVDRYLNGEEEKKQILEDELEYKRKPKEDEETHDEGEIVYNPNQLSLFSDEEPIYVEPDRDIEAKLRKQKYSQEDYDIIYDFLTERFTWYYTEDPAIGQNYISDYGLQPLSVYMLRLNRTDEPGEKVTIIDQMLNVVHQRSDMAGWFVEGGSRALNQLSGTPEYIEEPEEMLKENKKKNLMEEREQDFYREKEFPTMKKAREYAESQGKVIDIKYKDNNEGYAYLRTEQYVYFYNDGSYVFVYGSFSTAKARTQFYAKGITKERIDRMSQGIFKLKPLDYFS